MALIDLSNFDSATLGLVQSTQGRTGTPTGNVFFDVATGRIELITAEEQATIDMSGRGGSASAPNPLIEADGVKLEALYAFEREQRKADEVLRQYDYFFKGTFKFGGAYELVNGRKFDDGDGSATSNTTDDRFKVRGSGWIERDSTGAIGRIYYGTVSLGTILAGSQPYYQAAAGHPTSGAPTSYNKVGPIDEAVQVQGNITVDANTTTFDERGELTMKIRTYGQNADEKNLTSSGVSQMDGYSTGFALGESVHLTTNTTDHPIASVYNATPASQTGVWLNMTLEELAVPQVEAGFNETGGTTEFTWVLNNPSGATLVECIAYLDAIATQDADINAHVGNTTNGQANGVWYTYNAAGKILPQSGADSNGLFIEGLLGTDRTSVIFTDDSATTRTYPNFLSIGVNVGSGAVADANAWFHAFFETNAGNDFGTAGAITVLDSAGDAVKGTVAGDPYLSGSTLTFLFDYAGDSVGGATGINKNVVFECEGDGGVTAAKTIFTMTDPDISASISASCVPPAETNV
jgi:hypothetical protein